ncbi:MAG: CinA family protein [Acidimicrobiales bacterium]
MCPDPDAGLVPAARHEADPPVKGGGGPIPGALPEHDVVDQVRRRGWCLATAESMTGGLVARRLAAAPGSGACFRGGLVAYAPVVKHEVLGVRPGPVVAAEAAVQMAAGASRLFDADVAVATTGVAGPDELEGQPVGTVWLAVTTPDVERTERHRFGGTPDEVVAAATDHALMLLRTVLSSLAAGSAAGPETAGGGT